MSEKKIKLNDEMLKNVAGGDLQTWQWLLNDFTVRSGMVNTLADLNSLYNEAKKTAAGFLENGWLTQDEYDSAISIIDNGYTNIQHSFENE